MPRCQPTNKKQFDMQVHPQCVDLDMSASQRSRSAISINRKARAHSCVRPPFPRSHISQIVFYSHLLDIALRLVMTIIKIQMVITMISTHNHGLDQIVSTCRLKSLRADIAWATEKLTSWSHTGSANTSRRQGSGVPCSKGY